MRKLETYSIPNGSGVSFQTNRIELAIEVAASE
jgi:hypothetical protein